MYILHIHNSKIDAELSLGRPGRGVPVRGRGMEYYMYTHTHVCIYIYIYTNKHINIFIHIHTKVYAELSLGRLGRRAPLLTTQG